MASTEVIVCVQSGGIFVSNGREMVEISQPPSSVCRCGTARAILKNLPQRFCIPIYNQLGAKSQCLVGVRVEGSSPRLGLGLVLRHAALNSAPLDQYYYMSIQQPSYSSGNSSSNDRKHDSFIAFCRPLGLPSCASSHRPEHTC